MKSYSTVARTSNHHDFATFSVNELGFESITALASGESEVTSELSVTVPGTLPVILFTFADWVYDFENVKYIELTNGHDSTLVNSCLFTKETPLYLNLSQSTTKLVYPLDQNSPIKMKCVFVKDPPSETCVIPCPPHDILMKYSKGVITVT